MNIRVIAIDDHPMILNSVATQIDAHSDMQLIATDNRGSHLLKLVRENNPDVAILDLGMTNEVFDPISAVRALHEQYPKVKVLILTGYDDSILARELLKVGACGYILKSDDFSMSIPQAIRTLYSGKRFFSLGIAEKLLDSSIDTKLTDREISVLFLLSKGLSTEAVANNLAISEKRVRNLLVSICDKLEIERSDDVSTRIAAINKARKLGLIPDEKNLK